MTRADCALVLKPRDGAFVHLAGSLAVSDSPSTQLQRLEGFASTVSRSHDVELGLDGSAIGASIVEQDRCVAVLLAFRSSGNAFSARDLQVLTLLSKVTGAALHRIREGERHYRESRLDPLTQVSNRRAFDEVVREELARFQTDRDPFSIALLDLDRFKAVNDTHGHLAGDTLLAHIAAIIAGQMRVSDACFRIGGDEFAVILPHTSAAEALHALVRIAKAVHRSHEVATNGIGLSYGLAQVQHNDDVHTLISRADAALYREKRKRTCGKLGVA